MPDALIVLTERPLHLMRSSVKREIVQPFNDITTRMSVPVLKRAAYYCGDRFGYVCPFL